MAWRSASTGGNASAMSAGCGPQRSSEVKLAAQVASRAPGFPRFLGLAALRTRADFEAPCTVRKAPLACLHPRTRLPTLAPGNSNPEASDDEFEERLLSGLDWLDPVLDLDDVDRSMSRPMGRTLQPLSRKLTSGTAGLWPPSDNLRADRRQLRAGTSQRKPPPNSRAPTSVEGHCAGNRNGQAPRARQAIAKRGGPGQDGYLG